MNSSPDANDDSRLDAMLRSTHEPLANDGFSSRVLAALPPAKAESSSWRRVIFCLAGLIAGCGFVLWRGVSWVGLQTGAERLIAPFAQEAPSPLSAPWFATALTLAGLSLVVAFRAELRERFL